MTEQASTPLPRAATSDTGRGAIVGVAVVIALVALWYWPRTCDAEGFECLGQAVVTLFAMPLVAFLVGWIVGAVVHVHRPWLVALIGPFAAYPAVRVSDG